MSEEPRLFFASSDEPRMLSKANDYKTVKSAAMRAMLCGLWAAKLPSLCAVGWLHSRVGVCVHGCACMHARVRERHRAYLFVCERAVLVVRSTHCAQSALSAGSRSHGTGRSLPSSRARPTCSGSHAPRTVAG